MNYYSAKLSINTVRLYQRGYYQWVITDYWLKGQNELHLQNILYTKYTLSLKMRN